MRRGSGTRSSIAALSTRVCGTIVAQRGRINKVGYNLAQHLAPHHKDAFNTSFMRRRVVVALFIASFFLAFTWRGLSMYYTGDDVGNLYQAWSKPAASLIRANVLFWSPDGRPLVEALYLVLFSVFGFNPQPLYILFYAILFFNLYLAYRTLLAISASAEVGVIGVLLFSVHASFDYLYYNAGALFDACCFMFFLVTLLIYLHVRGKGGYLKGWTLAAFAVSYICCLNSKEMGVTLPLVILLYELLLHPPRTLRLSYLGSWLRREGRGVIVAGACVLIYLPAKLGAEGASKIWQEYRPEFTLTRLLENTQAYLGYLTYHGSLLTPLGVCLVYGGLAATALCPFGKAA